MTFSFIHFNTYLRDLIKFNTNDLIFRDLVNKEFLLHKTVERNLHVAAMAVAATGLGD